MADLKFYVEHNKVAFLEKTKRKSDGFHDIIDFINSTPIRYALVTNPIVRESLVCQFWATASEVSLPDGTVGIEATIDGHAHTITEASIRSSLRLNDQGATVCLPTDDIYSGLAAIGYVPDQGVWRLCFFKNKFSPQWKFLVHTLIHCIDSKEVPPIHPDPTPSTVDPLVTESAHASSVVVTSSGPTVDLGQSSTAPVVTQGMGSSGSTPVVPSDPLRAPVLSPIMEEETGGGPVFESPLRSSHVSPPVTPLVSTTEGVAGDPVTLTSLSLVLINKVKRLEAKLKQRQHNAIVSDEDDEMVEQDADWDAFLDLARCSPTSASSISVEKDDDSAEMMDAAAYTISAISDVVSAAVGIPAASSGLATSIPSPLFTTSTVVSTTTAAHPSTSFAPSTVEKTSSPLRDPKKGKGVAEPTSPDQSLTKKDLEDQHAAILEAKRQEAFEMETKQSQVAEQIYYNSLLAQRLVEEEERE
ncbi:hypothetical protein Tco_1466151 [Tanacetum coccineum]